MIIKMKQRAFGLHKNLSAQLYAAVIAVKCFWEGGSQNTPSHELHGALEMTICGCQLIAMGSQRHSLGMSGLNKIAISWDLKASTLGPIIETAKQLLLTFLLIYKSFEKWLQLWKKVVMYMDKNCGFFAVSVVVFEGLYQKVSEFR